MERYVGGGVTNKLDRLDRLQTDMTDELSRMERDWNDARNSFNWSQSGMEGAFDVAAKSVSDSRTRVNKILRSIVKFRADEVAWEQHGIAMALMADPGPPKTAPGLVAYFVKDYPLMNRRCDFMICKQAQGELFKTWWERKKAMAVECDLGAMKGNDWLRMELVRGVNDTRLQKRLLQEQQATLPQLILIAKQWQAADGTQTAFGSESTEYTRQTSEYDRLQEDRVAETHRGGPNPTPMMEGIKVFPRDGGVPFTFRMCPDTGCTATLISEDVVTRQGLTKDTHSRKRIRTVNGQEFDNSGMVTFGVEFQKVAKARV